MSQSLTVRRASSDRTGFGNYEYDIYDGATLIARYWHDYRGGEHGITFTDGNTEDWPVGRMTDFLTGGGPQPLRLSPAAVEWLRGRISQ